MDPGISVELAHSALQCIPANLPRDEWARIGMAIKSEFPDDEGLEWACTEAGSLKTRVRESSALLASQIVPPGASGQVERVGARFALVGAAGELATQAGLTGWPAGEAEWAAKACFDAWLASRGGIGNGEVMSMLRAVRRFLEAHGEGRFTWWHRAADDHNAKTLNRAGFRRLLDALKN